MISQLVFYNQKILLEREGKGRESFAMRLRPPNTCQLKFGLSYPHLHGIFILPVSNLDLYRACPFEKLLYNGIFSLQIELFHHD